MVSGRGLTSGLIHAAASPFGRARNRTDSSSNFIWSAFERHAFTTGDFTAAVFVKFAAGAGVALNAFSNGSGANQWRLMPHYNGSGYAANNATFWTYDGGITQVTAANAFDPGVASWLVGVRRGTTLQLWRNGVLLAEATGTARNVTGGTSGAIQLGNGTANSQGLHGPSLLWRRALTAAEIMQLAASPTPYQFVTRPVAFRMAGVDSGLQTYTYSASGGISFSGAAAYIRERVISTLGGLQFGGTAAVSFVGLQTRVVTPSGGLEFGGAAAKASVRQVAAPAGGVQFGGAASVILHESVRTVTPSGGIEFGGAAYVYIPALASQTPYQKFIYGRKGLATHKYR